jgi:hypothetical protein
MQTWRGILAYPITFWVVKEIHAHIFVGLGLGILSRFAKFSD